MNPDAIILAACETYLRTCDKANPDDTTIYASGGNVPFTDAASHLKESITVHIQQGGTPETFDLPGWLSTNYAPDLTTPTNASSALGLQALFDAMA